MIKALIFSGYGLNCEEETKFAFELSGAKADIVHINDLIEDPKRIRRYQIMAFPGGFAYGDDTGSGKAYANKVRNHLWDEILRFIEAEKLIIGICNGFQIITNLGIVPGALAANKQARYIDRWVDLEVKGKSPWLTGIKKISVPIAHGEGRFVADPKTMKEMKKNNQIALQYVKGDICKYQDLEGNPNGATENVAGVTAYDGRVLGLMPHPERAMFMTQLPNFPYLAEKAKRDGKKLPKDGPGLQIFRNAVNFF